MNKIDLQFTDSKKIIESYLGKDGWIVAYSFSQSDDGLSSTYSALISEKFVKKSIEHVSWDLFTGKETREYYHFTDGGIKPLIFDRNFNTKNCHWEISEEFRLYFNLYEYRDKNKFVKIDDDGDEDDVVLVEDGKIQIKLKYLKEFLAVKKMQLAIFFDLHRFSTNSLKKLQIKETYGKITKGNDYIYSIIIQDYSFGNKKSHGRLIGKKLIAGLKDFKPPLFNKPEEYENFITGTDEDGNEIVKSCNPDKAPSGVHVFFRKKVLEEYYSNSENCTVEDGSVSRNGLWNLCIDNSHKKYLVVFLKDLGEQLSPKEQKRWRLDNITPSGKTISTTAYKRWIEGVPCDPEISDLYFKQYFESFQGKWEKKFGWKLFKPLRKEDDHCFKCLRIPLTEEQKEFDEQVGYLVKIIIDSLNEEELKKRIIINGENPLGIIKFELFLTKEKFESKDLIKFLRDLQDLRSGVAHRKGEKYQKAAKIFFINEKDFSAIFDEILIKTIRMLDSLERYFLNNQN